MIVFELIFTFIFANPCHFEHFGNHIHLFCPKFVLDWQIAPHRATYPARCAPIDETHPIWF